LQHITFVLAKNLLGINGFGLFDHDATAGAH